MHYTYTTSERIQNLKIKLFASTCVIALNIAACSTGTEEKSSRPAAPFLEKKAGDVAKKKPFHGDLKVNPSAVSATPGIDALKNNHLEVSSTKTIGEVFDAYTYAIQKEWRETPSQSGPHYIDYIAWFQINPLSSTSLKEGVVKRGLEIKFVVRGNGETYIAMASRIDINSNGMRNSAVIDPSEIRNIVTAIYENREISF